jgi:hypothetical protein
MTVDVHIAMTQKLQEKFQEGWPDSNAYREWGKAPAFARMDHAKKLHRPWQLLASSDINTYGRPVVVHDSLWQKAAWWRPIALGYGRFSAMSERSPYRHGCLE